MSRLRYRFAPVLVWMLVPILHAQEKAPSPWLIDRSLTVSPRTAPVPALKYRLSPLKSDLKEGNAAPIYLRLVHEQNDASRKYWSETPRPWNLLPVDKIPLEEARKFLDARRDMLRQFEIGARRRTVDWNYTLDEGNIISILLPDAQVMRQYVPMLVLQIRVALAEGDFAKAAHHMETGFAFSQHVGDGPFLINSLVGIALAAQFTGTIADLIERSDAPNFYWAIATLPHPFIDMRRALDQEYRTFEGMYPELADVEREQSAEHWNATLRRIRMDLRGLATERDKLPDWYPKNCAGGSRRKIPRFRGSSQVCSSDPEALRRKSRVHAGRPGVAALHCGNIPRRSRCLLRGLLSPIPTSPNPVYIGREAAPRFAEFGRTRACSHAPSSIEQSQIGTDADRTKPGRSAIGQSATNVCCRSRWQATRQTGRRDGSSCSQRSRHWSAVRV